MGDSSEYYDAVKNGRPKILSQEVRETARLKVLANVGVIENLLNEAQGFFDAGDNLDFGYYYSKIAEALNRIKDSVKII
jgi:hypothetical protein